MLFSCVDTIAEHLQCFAGWPSSRNLTEHWLMCLCACCAYRRLLERHQLYEKQLAEMGAGLQEEMEELLTPDEKKKVASIKRNIAK